MLINLHKLVFNHIITDTYIRVRVQGVKSVGGHFACLCREFDFYEVKQMKNIIIFQKDKVNTYFYTFNHFYSEKSSKRAK